MRYAFWLVMWTAIACLNVVMLSRAIADGEVIWAHIIAGLILMCFAFMTGNIYWLWLELRENEVEAG